jgi:hypothetical protein
VSEEEKRAQTKEEMTTVSEMVEEGVQEAKI